MPESKGKGKALKADKKTTPFREVLGRLGDSKTAMIGLAIIIIYILVAIFASKIAPYDYKVVTGKALLKPGAEHLFGTDNMGRDVFSRVVYGARYSLFLGVCSTAIGVALGMVFGCIAGYYGGVLDEVFMRISDILQSIPGVLLNMALSVAFGAGLFNTMLALGLSIVASVARLQRAAILNVREMEYIDAARVINCSDIRINFKHIIPNSLSSIIVYASMEIGHVIMMAASLSFLGLGVQPPTPEWGALLSDGRNYIKNAPHLCILPGIVLVVFVLAMNLLGDGLRDALDPKLKK